jgi:hypothetical protein
MRNAVEDARAFKCRTGVPACPITEDRDLERRLWGLAEPFEHEHEDE